MFWVKLPKQVVASTALDSLRNDGVISIYNEGDETFQHIYYYRDNNNQSVRFNCVSTIGINENLVGAAVGLSNGAVMFAQIPYDNDKLQSTVLTDATCPQIAAIPEISSITAVKALQYDYNSDGDPETIIIAGGVRKSGEEFVIRVCDVTNIASRNEFSIKLEGNSTTVKKVTDILVMNDYLYVSAVKLDANGKECGVIYACPLSSLEQLNGKGTKDKGELMQVELINHFDATKPAWIVNDKYYTSFGVNTNGDVYGIGEGVSLPVINSIASKKAQKE